MAGLFPAIHDFLAAVPQDVDARHKAGHDENECVTSRIPHETRCSPASIRTSSPVMLLDAGVARKHTSCAISSADEATLSGTRATTLSRTCLAPSSPRPLVNQGVSL